MKYICIFMDKNYLHDSTIQVNFNFSNSLANRKWTRGTWMAQAVSVGLHFGSGCGLIGFEIEPLDGTRAQWGVCLKILFLSSPAPPHKHTPSLSQINK